MTTKLRDRTFYSDMCFTDNVMIKHILDLNKEAIVGRWEDETQY